ncbi:MAG TPA: RNA polymerase sigma factor [Acidimicrobiia bacterium]|nr:RNA polymerase sigma factor [Acidimicrobiia bacterium]
MTNPEARQLSYALGLGEAYGAWASELLRFATVLVGPDDAADVVSSAVIRVLDRSPQPIHNHRAYLFRVVANEARNWKRGEARRRVRESTSSIGRNVVHPLEPYLEVHRAVEELSVRQRAVVHLAYWADLDESSIADHLGISAGSVRRHLARARKKLRGVLGEYT